LPQPYHELASRTGAALLVNDDVLTRFVNHIPGLVVLMVLVRMVTCCIVVCFLSFFFLLLLTRSERRWASSFFHSFCHGNVWILLSCFRPGFVSLGFLVFWDRCMLMRLWFFSDGSRC